MEKLIDFDADPGDIARELLRAVGAVNSVELKIAIAEVFAMLAVAQALKERATQLPLP